MTTHTHAALHPVEDGMTTSPPARRSRKAFLLLGATTAALLLAIGSYMLLTRNRETTDDAQIEADVVPIASRVAGQLLRLHVGENQQVKKGTLLFELDDADFVARVEQTHAELATAEAQALAAEAQEKVVAANATGGLRSAKAMVSGSSVGVAAAAARIAEANAAVQRAQGEVKKTSLELSRAKQLRNANAIPQERLDNAQIAADSARAALAQATASLAAADEARHAAQSHVAEARGHLAQSSSVEAQIAAARAASRLARARVKVAQAAVKLAELQLSYTRVAVPDDGVVSKITVHQGQLISVGQPVATLVPNRTYVMANFKETQIGRMRAGERAVVELDAFPRRKLEGRIESLSGGTGARFSLLPPDNATGNFVKVVQRVPVRISWVNPPAELALRAGLSATVTVHLERN